MSNTTPKLTPKEVDLLTPPYLVAEYLNAIFAMPDEKRAKRINDRKQQYKYQGKKEQFIAMCTAIGIYKTMTQFKEKHHD